MPRVLFSDYEYPDLDLERKLFEGAGTELVAAQCRTESDVIEAAAGCAGILLQYAPITERVRAAPPPLGIGSPLGVRVRPPPTPACARPALTRPHPPDH